MKKFVTFIILYIDVASTYIYLTAVYGKRVVGFFVFSTNLEAPAACSSKNRKINIRLKTLDFSGKYARIEGIPR